MHHPGYSLYIYLSLPAEPKSLSLSWGLWCLAVIGLCLLFAGKALKCLPAALLFSQTLKNLGDMLVLVMLESLRNQM